MTGRALTVEQKRAVLKRILNVWAKSPEQRLGQLVVNSGIALNTLFSIEDEALANLLETKTVTTKEKSK